MMLPRGAAAPVGFESAVDGVGAWPGPSIVGAGVVTAEGAERVLAFV